MSVTERVPVSFELDRFELVAEDRLEVGGRWYGVRGRRFMRPSLTPGAEGRGSRTLALLDHKPWAASDGTPWVAAFQWDGDPAELIDAELAVTPDIAVSLPAPTAGGSRGKRRPAAGRKAAVEARAERLVADRSPPPAPTGAEPAVLRRERKREKAVGALEERRADSSDLRGELEHARVESSDLRAELERARTESSDLRAELERARADSSQLRGELERARAAELQSASSLARRDAALERLDEAIAERDSARQARDDAIAARDELLRDRRRLAAERDRAIATRDRAIATHDRAIAAHDRIRNDTHERERVFETNLGVLRTELERERAKGREAVTALAQRDATLAEKGRLAKVRDTLATEVETLRSERERELAERDPVAPRAPRTVVRRSPAGLVSSFQQPSTSWMTRMTALAALLAIIALVAYLLLSG
jgi:hypothetical protein